MKTLETKRILPFLLHIFTFEKQLEQFSLSQSIIKFPLIKPNACCFLVVKKWMLNFQCFWYNSSL